MSYSKAVCVALIALALSACDTMPRANVKIPQSLLQQCQPLQKLEGMTGADLLRNIVANAEVYYECKDIHDSLVKAVSEDKPAEK